MSEQGARLYIRPHTLREWRRDFAQYLRGIGVEANATERAVRGETRLSKRDGIHRAILRNDSTHMRGRIKAVARELADGELIVESGKRTLTDTRCVVLQGWCGLADILECQRHFALAASVRRFVNNMPQPKTDKEHLAEGLTARSRNRHALDGPAR